MAGYLPLAKAKTQEMVMTKKIMRRICWARLFLFPLEVVGREGEMLLEYDDREHQSCRVKDRRRTMHFDGFYGEKRGLTREVLMFLALECATFPY